MPRKLRVQYPGAHNRGDRWENIFEDDDDRYRFLKTLAEACGKTGWQVHAYCLMSNHFHLVIETLRIPAQFGQRSDFSRTVIRFNSDAVPIQFGQRSGE